MESIVLTICYNDADFSASFLCDHCGQKFILNQGLKTHFSRTHDKSFLLLINYKSIFSETAKLLNYPDKLDLPNRIETEINYLFENYKKDDLLRQISVFFQTNWDAHLMTWRQFQQVRSQIHLFKHIRYAIAL